MHTPLPTVAWEAIAGQIAEHTGTRFRIERVEPASGGCVSQSWVLYGGERRFFVKLASTAGLDMLEAEIAGLSELLQGAVRVPEPICIGSDADRAWLVLEYLRLRAGRASGWRQLGAALAAQHRRLAPQFGWRRDNTIGATAQANAWSADWPTFLRDRRLGSQLQLAERNGFGRDLSGRGGQLLDCLGAFFPGYSPRPSLLHGDLWCGNVGFLYGGEPVIFDPAVYYGDREADIAMTELFGGFGTDFYTAYAAAWPLEAGYPVRRRLYNLYHLLNHLNLFGAGYLGECCSTIDWLLARS